MSDHTNNTEELYRARARIGILTRRGTDPEGLNEARQDLFAAQVRQTLSSVYKLDTARRPDPILRPEQREALADLILNSLR